MTKVASAPAGTGKAPPGDDNAASAAAVAAAAAAEAAKAAEAAAKVAEAAGKKRSGAGGHEDHFDEKGAKAGGATKPGATKPALEGLVIPEGFRINNVGKAHQERTQAGLQPVANQALAAIRDAGFTGVVGGLGHRPNKSDHPHGLALDLMTTDKETGNNLSKFLIMNADKLGTKYVIWNGQIASEKNGWQWRPYTGRSPHTDHVHVSFHGDGNHDAAPDHYHEPAESGAPGSWASAPAQGSGFVEKGQGGISRPIEEQPAPSQPEQTTLTTAAAPYNLNVNWLWMLIQSLLSDDATVARLKEQGLLPEDWEPGDEIPAGAVDALAAAAAIEKGKADGLLPADWKVGDALPAEFTASLGAEGTTRLVNDLYRVADLPPTGMDILRKASEEAARQSEPEEPATTPGYILNPPPP